MAKSPAWQRSEGQSEAGGLNAKGRASLKRQGKNIKAPVTEKNPKGKRAKRRASFCRRMKGMKKKLTGEKTRNDPDSRINKSLRRWKCSSLQDAAYLDGVWETLYELTKEAGKRPGLWDNIHAKRKRIAAGSGEKMRKPGTKGAPTAKALQESKTKEAFFLGFAETLETYLGRLAG